MVWDICNINHDEKILESDYNYGFQISKSEHLPHKYIYKIRLERKVKSVQGLN